MFDGVHLGHRRIIAEVTGLARANGSVPAAMTFDPHPRAVLCPDEPPVLLVPLKERVRLLREAGAEVLGVASIFTYGMQKGLDRMREANVTNYSLSNLDALVEVAAEEGYIKPEDKARLIAFRNNPSDESWMK